jgi:hypothetical protein
MRLFYAVCAAILIVGMAGGARSQTSEKAGKSKGKKEQGVKGKEAVGAAFTESFHLDECSFSSQGKNRFFILEPGYQLTFERVGKKNAAKVVKTVLNETKKIGKVETRVIEEKETEDGELIEVSRNFYAIDTKTNTVFYFGEDVDTYEKGKVTGHGGSWIADPPKASAGVMMPGIALLGARHYQEVAPGVAMDRAEIVSDSESLATPAGKFSDCLKTQETTPLEPNTKEYKLYAPGVGQIMDADLVLTHYGYINGSQAAPTTK